MRLAGSSYFAAAVAAAAALVGLLGSVYQNEIASAFPLVPFGPFDGWSLQAIVFWSALVILAALVSLRQVADDRVRQTLVTTTEAAEQATRRIETLIETLPPAGFQTQMTHIVLATNGGVSTLLPRDFAHDTSPCDLLPVVRSILKGLATLAATYDGSPMVEGKPALYSANVMVFVPNELATGLQLRFCPVDQDRARLRGVLLLRHDMSATSGSDDEDAGLPHLALPIPIAPERNGRWIALPGGPRAFLTGDVDGYVDASRLALQCREQGDFPPSVVEDVQAYFGHGEGRAISSFVSRRLDFLGQPIGVLNLHANRRDLLGPRNEKRDTFHALVTGLVTDLADAVGAIVAADGPLPRPAASTTMDERCGRHE